MPRQVREDRSVGGEATTFRLDLTVRDMAGLEGSYRGETRDDWPDMERLAELMSSARYLSRRAVRCCGSLDVGSEDLIDRRIAGRVFHAVEGTSCVEQRLDYSRKLAFRMTLLHQAVV